MTKFSNKEEIHQALTILKRDGELQFENIEVSNFKIVIGGGLRAFSDPRRFIGKLFSYKSVQIQIFEIVNGEERIIKPLSDERFQKFTWAKYFAFEKNGTSSPSSMGYYVPSKEIPTMIHEIYRVSKLKVFF